jgi:hypothetical protein
MEAIRSPDMAVLTRATRSTVPEDGILKFGEVFLQVLSGIARSYVSVDRIPLTSTDCKFSKFAVQISLRVPRSMNKLLFLVWKLAIFSRPLT